MLIAAGTDKAVRIYAPDGDGVMSLDHGTSIDSAALSPDGWQLATFSFDPTAGARVRFWDLQSRMELFALHLPSGGLAPAGRDFDFRCARNGVDGKAGRCWIAAPLTDGSLALYDLGNPYD
jgi:WD40 repeat protein